MQNKLDFAIFAIFLFVSIVLAIFAFSFGGMDFNVYYAAARVTMAGGNPYDFQQLAPQIISNAGKMNNPYYYAPWFTWIISLFALFPYEVARVMWAVFNYVLWLWGLFNLTQLIRWNTSGWKKWGIYLYLTFLFAWATWGSEQVGIVIFVAFTLVLFSFQKEKWIHMGIWMAVLLFKPNVTALPVMITIFWLVLHHKWMPILAFCAFLTLMISVSLVISPGWYMEILQPEKVIGLSYTLNQNEEIQIERYTTTLLDWLSLFHIEGYWSYGIYIVAILVGVFFTWKIIYASQSLTEVISIAVLVNFALVPYTLFYDYPPLSLTLFCINSSFVTRTKFVWLQKAMNGLVFVSLFIGNDIRHRYWMVIILFVFSWFSGIVNKTSYNQEITLSQGSSLDLN